jgi:DNA-binding transcriptional ArsR family regulator
MVVLAAQVAAADLLRPTAKLCKVDNPDGGPLTAEEVCQVLCAALMPAGSLLGRGPGSVPDEPGLYAWWAAPGALPGVPTTAHPPLPLGLLYVGIAGTSLRQRIVSQHLAANTGSSTFRFTLASHLLIEGGLTPYRKGKKVLLPRAQLDWLLRWQVSHLHVSWVARRDPADVEAAVIAAMQPPLNGDDNEHHSYRQQLRGLRAAFRLKAKDGPAPGE